MDVAYEELTTNAHTDRRLRGNVQEQNIAVTERLGYVVCESLYEVIAVMRSRDVDVAPLV